MFPIFFAYQPIHRLVLPPFPQNIWLISIFLISIQVIAPNFRHGRLEGGGGTEK